jgi:hypothetical protein
LNGSGIKGKMYLGFQKRAKRVCHVERVLKRGGRLIWVEKDAGL